MIYITFTETEKFVRQAVKILGDEGINELQLHLCEYPDDGAIIKASGGIRKMRWAASGRGKRGGTRIIYYYAVGNEGILLLDIYPKNEKTDLSAEELENLKDVLLVWLEKIK
ncbi:MAG: type II toxin-antitoxin system RelE/ParE family toxin [Acidobacteria bacterium]|nr:type II toxin-antitoxin system RelE/ParE family toxin [Acidobacteriota bacterium]